MRSPHLSPFHRSVLCRIIQPALHRCSLRSTDLCSAESFSLRCIAARSVPPIRAQSPQIGSVAACSAPQPPPTASPLPLPSASRAGAGRQPAPVPRHGPARHGPARDVTSWVTASRWPRRGGRDQGDVIIIRLCSRPAPYPIVFHSSESAGVLGPLRGCVRA